jgi:hypothetical protein
MEAGTDLFQQNLVASKHHMISRTACDTAVTTDVDLVHALVARSYIAAWLARQHRWYRYNENALGDRWQIALRRKKAAVDADTGGCGY